MRGTKEEERGERERDRDKKERGRANKLKGGGSGNYEHDVEFLPSSFYSE